MNSKLSSVTLTGVDETTSLEKLKAISHQYPEVEWGILFAEDTNGFSSPKRYPSVDWFLNNLEKIKEIKDETNVSFALHVCGKSVNSLLNNQNEALDKIIPYFNRVQINFIYKEKKLLLVESLFAKYPEITFITQHNDKNIDAFINIKAKNHQVLFDKSGGRGVTPNSWDKPLKGKTCGYAGGLSPENTIEELEKILTVTEGNTFWIDMEGKIRTNELLDLDKCTVVLENVDSYFKKMNQFKF